MPTRRLIGLALLCGLAILAAGGIQLIRIGRAKNDSALLTLGESRDVRGVTATVQSASRKDTMLTLIVRVTAGNDDLPDATRGWSVVKPGAQLVDRTTSDCQPDAKIGPRQSTTCSIEFDAGSSPTNELLALFGYDNKVARWSLVADAAP